MTMCEAYTNEIEYKKETKCISYMLNLEKELEKIKFDKSDNDENTVNVQGICLYSSGKLKKEEIKFRTRLSLGPEAKKDL